MTLRQLIEYARRNGWDHTVYGAWQTKQHVWRNAQWHISAEEYPTLWRFEVERRAGLGWTQIATFLATDVESFAGWMRSLGVLPAWEVAA